MIHASKPQEETHLSERGLRRFAVIMGLLLVGYALFDRAFAWIHIPGTPLFVGEVVLALGVLSLLTTKVRTLSLVGRSLPLLLLAIFMGWGFTIFATGVGDYSVDALRDITLWYYGLYAILIAVILATTRGPEWWIKGYAALVPWILVWLPIAMVLSSFLGDSGLRIPDSTVAIFSHSNANIAIHAGLALAFLWTLGDSYPTLVRYRVPLSALALMVGIAAGFTSRAGLLALGVGGLVLVIGMPRFRSRLIWLIVAVIVSFASLLLIFDVEIRLFSSQRTISAQQFVDNAVSILSPENSEGTLRENRDWRTGLWGKVLNDVRTDRPLAGFGFGPDIRTIYGVQDEDPPARSPHSSHVNIVARMGLIGGILWALMWITWFWHLWRRRSSYLRAGLIDAVGLVVFLAAAASMFLVNGIFNEMLEGPHTAIWMWSIFGFGAYVGVTKPRVAPLQPATLTDA